MKLSRRTSWFLTAFGVWSLIIWTTFVKNLWKDSGGQAFTDGDHSQPTAFFWVHLTLAVTSFVLGALVGAVGVRGLRGTRKQSLPD
ncbi:SCO4848 family membrane protein [Kitasatospora sp. NPDC050543]|uniref:SCO4848 family membrane protein n=1 Tax=Kitasatospora sp. NPDC050543 TaxID=3364054 RepID=UPI00378FEEED